MINEFGQYEPTDGKTGMKIVVWGTVILWIIIIATAISFYT